MFVSPGMAILLLSRVKLYEMTTRIRWEQKKKDKKTMMKVHLNSPCSSTRNEAATT